MNYPSRIITMGERDSDLVKQIQSRINELLCGPIAVDGIFGIKTTWAIAAYQCWHRNRLPERIYHYHRRQRQRASSW